MTDNKISTVVIDSTVFSNFAYTDSVDIIVRSFNDPVTTGDVIDELRMGVSDGHGFLTNALQYLPEPGVVTEENHPISASSRMKGPIMSFIEAAGYDVSKLSNLDKGERSVINRCLTKESLNKSIPGSVADANEKDAIATDDWEAREIAKEWSIPITGSIGILERAVSEGIISIEKADQLVDVWVKENGYYSPVDSLSELM